ncbi:MAG: DUF4169 family protein [Pseudomonadota bacterium]
MAKVTNLNQFRKAKARADKVRQAEENRARFGRTKADKTLSVTRNDKARSHLDGHKLDKDDE